MKKWLATATPLRCMQDYWARYDPPAGIERAGGIACQDAFHHLSAVLAIREGPS